MLNVPTIFSYVFASVIVAAFTIASTGIAMEIIFGWDRNSGKKSQIKRERRTYLVSIIMICVMSYELLSLFFFVAIADQIHIFFTGAMCAAGTLFSSHYGYVTLFLKIFGFLVSGFWLTINYLDNQYKDYPLLRFKYILLLPICALIICETVSGIFFFSGLDPQIVTSCCGVIFDSNRIASELAGLPVVFTRNLFFIVLVAVLILGVLFTGTGKGGHWFGLMNLVLLPVSLTAIISFLSLYFYELPTHHCPFCLLHREYNYIGYFLYICIFFGTLMGAGVGAIGLIKRSCGLKQQVGLIQRQFCIQALTAHILFALMACYPMFFSEFRL